MVKRLIAPIRAAFTKKDKKQHKEKSASRDLTQTTIFKDLISDVKIGMIEQNEEEEPNYDGE